MESSLDRIPDGIEPLVGYRAWHYTIDGPRASLYPISSADSMAWDGAESGWVVATCRIGCDPVEVPGERCGCGFYSMKSRELLAIEAMVLSMRSSRGDDAEPRGILGRVDLAGKIIEHEHGYRAERARVTELIPLATDEENSIRLAGALGLPLGDPFPLDPLPPLPDPPLRWLPPNGPSSIRLRVKDWVQDQAA